MNIYETIVSHLANGDISRAGILAVNGIKVRYQVMEVMRELCRQEGQEAINAYIESGIWKWGHKSGSAYQDFYVTTADHYTICGILTPNKDPGFQKNLASLLRKANETFDYGYKEYCDIPVHACRVSYIIHPGLFDALLTCYGPKRFMSRIIKCGFRAEGIAGPDHVEARGEFQDRVCALIKQSTHRSELWEIIKLEALYPARWLKDPARWLLGSDLMQPKGGVWKRE